MLHKACVVASVLILLIVLNAPMDWQMIHLLAMWSQGFWGSLACLAVAMLTLIPALLTLGTGAIEGISALSFGLFFWGRFLATHDWVPLAIFGAGAFFVAVEVLLVPGLGKPFILGAICFSAAILKAFPDHQQGMQALLTAYTALGTGLWIALKVVPKSQWAQRFVALKPPSAAESKFDPAADLQQYVGQTGEALTTLKPSGKVTVGSLTLGARTTGAFITAGSPVRVARVEANQLIVEAAE